MACEPYRDWLGDAALGALAPAREVKLRAHMEECAACRAELERTQQLLAAVGRGIEAGLAVEPSPDFAARVRRRLAEESLGSRTWLSGWMVAAAGALAVLALVVVWLGQRRGSRMETAVRTEATQAPAQSRPSPVTQSSGAGEKPAAARAVRRAQVARRRVVAEPNEPEVLVPPGQWSAIVRFEQALRSGRVDASLVLKEPAESLALEELKIPPLQLAKLDVDSKPPGPAPDR